MFPGKNEQTKQRTDFILMRLVPDQQLLPLPQVLCGLGRTLFPHEQQIRGWDWSKEGQNMPAFHN